MNRPATPWLAAALLGLSLSAGAQTGTQPSTPATTAPATGTAAPKSAAPKVERSDRRFVEHAAQGGMAEVALGRIASVRGTHPQVKSFGERMVQDHGKANEELKTVAAAKGIEVPEKLDRSHERNADRMGKLQGAEFDREYMKHMVEDHEKDVKDFEKASKDAKDPEIKAFAAKTLPTLQQHLQMAQTTYDQVKNVHSNAATTQGTTAPR